MKLLNALALAVSFHSLPALAQSPALPSPESVRLERLQLMQGFPPSPGKQVSFSTYLTQYPQLRWGFHHMRELMPSRNVPRGPGTVAVLAQGKDWRAQIDALRFNGPDGEQSFAEYLDNTYADATLILHNGKVIYEVYHQPMPAENPHIMWSMTKSVVGLLATQLIHEGRLDAQSLITEHLPELHNSGWKGATVQQLLDMTADVDYNEVYSDAQSDVVDYAIAAGMGPAPEGFDGARDLYSYLPTVSGTGQHGREFRYRTLHTEVLGWVLRRVTGLPTAELIGQRLWSKLGAEQDAYLLVDSVGAEWAGAGMNASLRDLARFGEMLRLGGHFNGQQIIAPEVLANIRQGADREAFKAANRIGQDGYSYHNQFWISHNPDGAYEALGVHGQIIHINPTVGLVVVRLSSHPVASTGFTFPHTRPALEALANLLRAEKASSQHSE